MPPIARPLLLLMSVLALCVLFNSPNPTNAVAAEMALDVGDVTGNSATSVGNINQCFQVASGASYTMDVVLISVTDAVASQFTTDRTREVLAIKNASRSFVARNDLNRDGAINVTDRTIVQLFIRKTAGLPCTP